MLNVTTLTLAGWAQAIPPVVSGEPPPGTVSLAALARAEAVEAWIPSIDGPPLSRKQAALHVFHRAIGAVTNTLVSPLVLDGVALDVAPDQLGIVPGSDGDSPAAWVGQVTTVDTGEPAEHAGRLCMRLLEPVAAAVRDVAGLGERGVANVMLDALANGCRRLERASPNRPGPGWVEAFIAATGHTEYRPGRVLLASPDDGPAIEFRMPRSCCVLLSKPREGSCPTCPQYPDDDTRKRLTEEWLRSLDEDAFRYVTGRRRVGQGAMAFPRVAMPE